MLTVNKAKTNVKDFAAKYSLTKIWPNGMLSANIDGTEISVESNGNICVEKKTSEEDGDYDVSDFALNVLYDMISSGDVIKK